MSTAQPATIDICRTRGDTFPLQFTLRDENSNVVDITGFTFTLTVDPSADPDTNTNNLFQLIGVLSDGPNGVFQFNMNSSEADQTPETYFYDVQMIDAANSIRTILKGKFTFEQDITK